jgi:hypothetical protein
MRNAYKYSEGWSGNLKGNDHLEDMGVDGRMKWILGK